MRKDIRNLFNGTIYGMALIIPGVSATIFAVILGFYDELIHTLNHFRENYRKNIRYLFVFVVGIAAGAVVFSSVVLFLLDNYSLPTMLLFIGLLVGIIPAIFSKTKDSSGKVSPREIVLSVLSMILLYFISHGFAEPAGTSGEVVLVMQAAVMFYIFIAGVVNGATLVIPGLSGALILLLMGLYPVVIFSVASIGTFLANPGNLILLQEILAILLPFSGGAVIGVLGMAKIMEKFLRDFPKAVYSVILGFICGSVITLFQNPLVYQSGTETPAIIAGVITFFAGCVLAYILGKKQ